MAKKVPWQTVTNVISLYSLNTCLVKCQCNSHPLANVWHDEDEDPHDVPWRSPRGLPRGQQPKRHRQPLFAEAAVELAVPVALAVALAVAVALPVALAVADPGSHTGHPS